MRFNDLGRWARRSVILFAGILATGCASFGGVDEDARASDPLGAAERLRQAGDPDAAVAAFAAMVEADPSNAHARFGLAESYADLGDAMAALQAYTFILDHPVLGPLAYQGTGLVYLEHGDLPMAEPALRQAVSADPNLWRSWNALARLADYRGDWTTAANAYEYAAATTPRPAVIENNRGYSLLMQGRYREAAEAFATALRYEPDLEVAAVNRSISLAMAEDYAGVALQDSGETAARDYNNAGYIAMVNQDYATAERLFALSLKASPTFYAPAFENMQALARMREGDIG